MKRKPISWKLKPVVKLKPGNYLCKVGKVKIYPNTILVHLVIVKP